jgi:membrane protease YdiL (CAAX protease family)
MLGLDPANPADERALLAIVLLYLVLIAAGLAAGVALLVRWRRRPVDWARGAARLQWRPWDGRAALLILGVVGLLQTLLWGFGLAFPHRLEALRNDEGAQIVLGSVMIHWTVLGLVAILVVRGGRTWRGAFGLEAGRLGRRAAEAAVFLLAAFPVILFYAVLGAFLLQRLGVDIYEQDVVRIIAGENSWPLRAYFAFLALVLAPVAEEIFFRGMVFPALAKRLRLGPSLLLSSVFFALIHGHAPAFIPLVLLACALGLAYVKTGNLLVPIMMHSLFNAHSLVVLLLRGGLE